MPWTWTMRLIALALTTLALLGLAAPAQAVAAADEEGATRCALVKPTDDDTISILGRICDRREQPPVAVPGVAVTVEDEDGNVVGEATSGEDGTFVVDLPGAPIELLSHSFTHLVRSGPIRRSRRAASLAKNLLTTGPPTWACSWLPRR